MALLLHRSTGFAGVFLIVYIVVPHAHGGLHVPMAREDPLITVGHSQSGVPSLVAAVFEVFRPVDGVEAGIDLCHIKLSAHSMHAEEMAVELGAEPIATFSDELPMAYGLAFGEFPRVQAVGELRGGSFSKPQLHAEVGRERGVVEQVGFDGNALRLCLWGCGEVCSHGQNHDDDRTDLSHCFFLNDVCFVDFFRGVSKQSQNPESVGLYLDWFWVLTSSNLVFFCVMARGRTEL